MLILFIDIFACVSSHICCVTSVTCDTHQMCDKHVTQKMRDKHVTHKMRDNHTMCDNHTTHYAEVEKLGSKWSTLTRKFSTNFQQKLPKFSMVM